VGDAGSRMGKRKMGNPERPRRVKFKILMDAKSKFSLYVTAKKRKCIVLSLRELLSMEFKLSTCQKTVFVVYPSSNWTTKATV
jgi:hypothetical protein